MNTATPQRKNCDLKALIIFATLAVLVMAIAGILAIFGIINHDAAMLMIFFSILGGIFLSVFSLVFFG